MRTFLSGIDTFSDSDRNLSAHTPDKGFGGWTYSGGAADWKISGNKAKKENIADNTTRFCRSDNDIVDDNFTLFADYTRGSGGDFSGDRQGLYLLAHKTTAIANGEGVEVVFIRAGSGSAMNLNIIRRDSAGVEQQNVLKEVVSIGAGASLRLGATVSGLDVQAWTEPAGGGTRTNRGSVLTLTADLRDGDHKRMGLTGRTESNAPRATMDNLTAEGGTLALLRAASGTERVFLIKFDFSGGALFLSTGSRDLVHDGETWEAVGGGLVIGGVEESGDMKGSGVDITLSGVNPAHIAVLLSENFRGRTMQVWQAILDPVVGTVVEAIDLFDGLQLDGYEIEERIVRGQPLGATIKTRGRHRLSIAEFRGIRTNVHGHQEYFNDDTFFAHTASLDNQKLFWGTSAPSRMGGGISDGEGGTPIGKNAIVL